MKTFRQFLLEADSMLAKIKRQRISADKEFPPHYNYSEASKKALRSYSEDSEDFSSWLTSPDPEKWSMNSRFVKWSEDDNQRAREAHKKTEEGIAEAIHSNQTPRDVVVFHGGGKHLIELMNQKPDENGERIWQGRQYLSTSLNKNLARGASDWSNTRKTVRRNGRKYLPILRIRVPKGSHSAYIGKTTWRNSEKELLFHKNSRIAVKGEPVYDDKKGIVILQGTLIHDGIKDTR